jgi:Tol biopolymer transport system component
MLDLTGKVIDSIPITGLRKDPAINGGSRYVLSRDETRIIFDMELDPAQTEENGSSAIFVYERRAKKTTKVTPAGYSCFQPVRGVGNRIFFTGWNERDPGFKREDPVLNIYSSAIDGSDFRLEFKNRRDYSGRR